MKKSEKTKGKERAEAKKRQNTLLLVAGAAICAIAIIAIYLVLNPVVAKAGDTVSVLYIGSLENGSVFDSNVNKTPLSFTIGSHNVIPGFEDAVIGMAKGEVKTVHIPVDRAYGPYRSDLVMTINRSRFSQESPPLAGMYYTVTSPADGSSHIVKVISVGRDTVTVDQNHMLAGQNLTFMIRILEISPKK